jgi:hypothetical protein
LSSAYGQVGRRVCVQVSSRLLSVGDVRGRVWQWGSPQERRGPAAVLVRLSGFAAGWARARSPLSAVGGRQTTNLAGVEGFEPPTCGFGDRCSASLSYTPVLGLAIVAKTPNVGQERGSGASDGRATCRPPSGASSAKAPPAWRARRPGTSFAPRGHRICPTSPADTRRPLPHQRGAPPH